MYALEVNPQWVWRIGDSTGGKSVCGQQVAELVLKMWGRHRQQRHQCRAPQKSYKTNQNHRERPAARHRFQGAFQIQEEFSGRLIPGLRLAWKDLSGCAISPLA